VTSRQLGWIFGVLAMLVAGWLLARDGSSDESTAEDLDLGALIGPGASYVRIVPSDGEPVDLERRSDGWTVNGYPARDSLVDATLRALAGSAPARLVARTRANHERLGLTAETGTRVSVGAADRPATEFLVGESGADGRFVRLVDADASHVLPPGILDPFTAGENEWRDFLIARVDTAALQRIVIRRGAGEAVELARISGAPSGWAVDGAPADTAVTRVYLETLANLEATGFPADSFVFAADFENPLAVVELYTAAESAAPPAGALLFSTGLDHPDVFVRRADDPIVYAIGRPLANLLTASAAHLRGR